MTNQAAASWEASIAGVGCSLCLPRADDTPFWLKIHTLRASTLYLDRNQTYRGHSQLVFDRRHVVGLDGLTSEEFAAFTADLRDAAQAIVTACRPDLMNYASLGNVVPHVHWHLVPRYRTDPRWGGPIYTTTPAEMPRTLLAEAEYHAIAEAIGAQLTNPA